MYTCVKGTQVYVCLSLKTIFYYPFLFENCIIHHHIAMLSNAIMQICMCEHVYNKCYCS